MSNKSNYANQHDKDYAALIEKYEQITKENNRLRELNRNLNKIIESTSRIENMISSLTEANRELTNTIDKLTKELALKELMLEKALDEIDRLKNNNNKNSSNSSKPSSTNGSKVIPNTRSKSKKPKGGQKGHKAHKLNEDKIAKMENNPNVKIVDKFVTNEEAKGYKYELDINFGIVLTKLITNDGKYNNTNTIRYGKNIKSLVILLSTDNYMTTDQITNFIRAISNNLITLSKGTVINWINEFSNNLDNEINAITDGLLNNYYIQADDSRIKVNKENYNQLCLCNSHYVYLTPSKRKNMEAWDLTVLPKFTGTVIKDGADIFDHYGTKQAQCLSHIIRYLKGAYEFGSRNSAKKLMNFLININKERNKLISIDVNSFKEKALIDIENKYEKLIEEWELEFQPHKRKIAFKEEKRLLRRMKGKDKKQILAFIHDFKIPSTNNNAESCQRGMKIKQKVGKFRSFSGAVAYCRIKSFILTIKKQGKIVIDSILKIFNKEPVLA